MFLARGFVVGNVLVDVAGDLNSMEELLRTSGVHTDKVLVLL